MTAEDDVLPPNLQEAVSKWLEVNAKKPYEVRWGMFPLGMVQRWIERATEAEENSSIRDVWARHMVVVHEIRDMIGKGEATSFSLNQDYSSIELFLRRMEKLVKDKPSDAGVGLHDRYLETLRKDTYKRVFIQPTCSDCAHEIAGGCFVTTNPHPVEKNGVCDLWKQSANH